MQAAIESAISEVALELGAPEPALCWDGGVRGAQYHEGRVVFGDDIREMALACAAGIAQAWQWWDLSRLIAHEVAHARGEADFGAVEEAIAETIGRAWAHRVMRLLPGAPRDSDEPDWDRVCPYGPQVRWLARLASWLGVEDVALALALKDRDEGASVQERLAGLLDRRLGPGVDRTRRLALAGTIIESAGTLFAGPHTRPRSPVAALRRALL